ncbi:MAG: DNA polymerase III [Treponema sp.]|nr:DNA polymerase III [Treponema sp.]
MYENLLHQEICSVLEKDISADCLPGAVLFSGSSGTGKLSCALETARILSCTGPEKGFWMCTCQSCLQHKALVNQNVVLAGPRDCTLETAAAASVLGKACETNASYLKSARYLFLRSVRKLTMRFNPVLWDGDDKVSKIAAVMSEIDELMETIDFPHELSGTGTLSRTCAQIQKLCEKLESTFLYDSIPVKQIRNVSSWARIKSGEGKKTVIIENADRMLESVRNALLKILEEPPQDTVFILTTSRRNAVMPTILSRVRTYQFRDRTLQEQLDVVQRIFHDTEYTGTLQEYIETFLSVPPAQIRLCAEKFFREIALNHLPDVNQAVKECGGFDPRLIFRLFLAGMVEAQKKLMFTAAGAECSALCVDAFRMCWNNVTVFNQSPAAALEELVRTLSKINRLHGMVFKAAV